MSQHMLDPVTHQGVKDDLHRYGFGVEPDSADGSVILRLHGELDLVSAPRLTKTLNAVFDSRPSAVTLDLSDLTFLDSTGIRTLVTGFRHATPMGCSFVLRSPRPNVLKTLRLIGIDQLIVIDTGRPDT